MSDLPARVLVLGLARSGRAAVTALAALGVAVVAHDASETVDGSDVNADVHLGSWDDALLEGVGLVVKSPGVPGTAAPVESARPNQMAASGDRRRIDWTNSWTRRDLPIPAGAVTRRGGPYGLR